MIGLACGYLVLHPIAMVIFRNLSAAPASAHRLAGEHSIWGPVAHSFAPSMVPMALVVALLTGAMAGANGFLRATIVGQRDELGRRADRLLDLERRNRRTARFLIHDLKNRLGVVVGVSDHLLQSSRARLDAGTVDGLERIHRQGHHVLATMKDLLDLARLEEQPELSFESISAADLLTRTADLYAWDGRPAVTRLAWTVDSSTSVVRADVGLIQRVLENLVDNALKHNTPGTRVLLSLRTRPGENDVRFLCQDDGQGVPAHLRDSLFDEFVGAPRVATGSTGLGLAFCRQAIRAHGGRIWCEDADGCGTRFYFTLPLVPETGDENEKTDSTHRGRRARLRRLPGHGPAGT